MKTVLIIEDNKEEQEKARKIYEDAGFKVVVAGSYEEFQEKSRQFNCYIDLLNDKKLYNDNDSDFPENKKTGELVDFIITDLTFPHSSSPDSEIGDFGYAVLIRAQKIGIPCHICTNTEHHGPSGKRCQIKEMRRVIGSQTSYSYRKEWSFLDILNSCEDE